MTVTSPPEVTSAAGPEREPVSPELALVDAELAARERARNDEPVRTVLSAGRSTEPVPDPHDARRLDSQVLRALASGTVLLVGIVSVLMLAFK